MKQCPQSVIDICLMNSTFSKEERKMFTNDEVYVIEKFDKIKNCYVFWNVVSTYKEAKDHIYKYMMGFSDIASGANITLSDGQVNNNDYFTVSCSFDDSPTITDKFRGHMVVIGMTDNYYLDRYTKDNELK